MSNRASILPYSVVLFAVCGCAAQIDPDAASNAEPGESVATTEEAALSTCSRSYPAPVQVNGTVVGPTRSSSICWPTRYDRRTSGATVDLIVNDQDGNWIFNGIGEVQCVKQCFFSETETGAERTLTDAFTSTATDSDAFDNAISVRSTAMWHEDAIALLTGIRHSPTAMSSNDGAFLRFSGDANTDVHLLAQTDKTSIFSFTTETITAVGYSFFVGVAHTGHLARKFIPPQLGPLQTRDTGFPTSRGICTISSLFSASSSSSAAATLTRSAATGTWIASTGSGVSASVVCYDFDQNPL